MVEKVLDCGDPEKMGYMEYLCMDCGQGHRFVSMSCKSPMCLRCGKVYVDNWVSQVSEILHPGVIYRHFILTIQEVLRKTFFKAFVSIPKVFTARIKSLSEHHGIEL